MFPCVSLGLAEPLLSNRFLVFGLLGTVTAVSGALNAVFLLANIDVLRTPFAQGIVAVTGMLQATLLYFTFLPPAFYRRRIEGGARVG